MKKEFFGISFWISENVHITDGLIKRLKAWAVDCPKKDYIVEHNEQHELVIV